MSKSAVARLAWLGMLVLSTFAPPAWGQITTSTITGTIKDQQGGVMPGATITLISETKGTQSTPVVTNDVGSFVVTNVTADTYTVQVEMPSFKTLRRAGLLVSAGSQISVPPLTLEVGGAAEVVTVTSEAPMIQASSGERSFAVSSEQVTSLPASTRAFIQYTILAPGVEGNGLQRIGGGGQSNVMMDGVSTMDTGNNGLMLQLTNESIAEVKLVASGYNAEFGRSSGLQISVVTKSGTNQFHGGVYDIERNSNWNSNSKTNILNGDPKTSSKQKDWGYSIGGPIGKPGGNNKLFFFYTQEYSPRTAGNDVVRFRVPTLLERAGDFSQSTDNNGAIYNFIKDPLSSSACNTTTTAGCFADGGVLGRIPSSRLYQTGLNILKMWPEPNVAPGLAYNYQLTRPEESALSWQPVGRVDYQPISKLRATFKATGWAQTNQVFNGSIPGFNDTVQAHPVVSLYAVTANYTFSPTLVVEATFGRSQNERAGCSPGGNQVGAVFCTGGVPVNPISNIKNAGLSDLPFLFPTSSLIDKRYYAYTALTEMIHSPVFENDRVMRPPTFTFGNRVANTPPSIPFPNYLNINTTADVSVSLTRVAGSHTMKTGFYRYHSYKAENQRNNAFGTLDFRNDSVGTNPFDTSFGFANAAIGSFSSYSQSSRYIEGQWDYYNTEAYAQDSWRVGSRMTVDAGLRFVHQEPLRDRLGQEANFFQDKWSLNNAPRLYVAGCANGVYPCTGTNRQALDTVTGQFLGPQSATAIGAVVPNTGNPLNGLLTQASGTLGHDGYTYPAIGVEPRLGFAYDLGGEQKFVIRGSGGLFFDRPSTSSYNQVNNPPIAQNVTVRFGQLQSLSSGLTAVNAPALQVIKFDSGLPSSAQWSGGVQTRLPWSLALDTAYVGQHAWNQASSIDLNTVDLGAAFLPQNQDATVAASATPGGSAITTDLLRAMRGYAAISVRADTSTRTYHSVQVSLQRRMRSGVSFGFADTISVSDRQNIVPRYQHDASGNVSIRSDQAEAEKLLGSSLTPLHTMRANAIWQLPKLTGSDGATKIVGAIVNDWQVSGIWSGITGTPYSVALGSYQNGANNNINVTGSPDFSARVRLNGDTGSGCSGDIYRQFTVTAFQGPLTGSTGLESSNDYLKGCFQSSIDMSLSRTIRFGGSKTLQLRMDVFNLPNTSIITNRNSTVTFASPTDNTITNLPYDAAGNLVAARSRPATAGFGMATAFQTPRSLQFQVRVGF